MFDVLKIKAPSTRVAEPHNTISALLKISLKISYQNLDSLLQIQDHIKTPTQEPLQLNAFVQPKCLFTHSISLRKPQHQRAQPSLHLRHHASTHFAFMERSMPFSTSHHQDLLPDGFSLLCVINNCSLLFVVSKGSRFITSKGFAFVIHSQNFKHFTTRSITQNQQGAIVAIVILWVC